MPSGMRGPSDVLRFRRASLNGYEVLTSDNAMIGTVEQRVDRTQLPNGRWANLSAYWAAEGEANRFGSRQAAGAALLRRARVDMSELAAAA
jgi:hypothetical protein